MAEYKLSLSEIDLSAIENGKTDPNGIVVSLMAGEDAIDTASLGLHYSSASGKAEYTWSTSTSGNDLVFGTNKFIVVNGTAAGSAIASNTSFSAASFSGAEVSITLNSTMTTIGTAGFVQEDYQDATLTLGDSKNAVFTSFKIAGGKISASTKTDGNATVDVTNDWGTLNFDFSGNKSLKEIDLSGNSVEASISVSGSTSGSTGTITASAHTSLTANVTLDLVSADNKQVTLTLAKKNFTSGTLMTATTSGQTASTSSQFTAAVWNDDDVVVVGKNAVKNTIVNFEAAYWDGSGIKGDKIVASETEDFNQLGLTMPTGTHSLQLTAGHTTVNIAVGEGTPSLLGNAETSNNTGKGIFRIGNKNNEEMLFIAGTVDNAASLTASDVQMLNYAEKNNIKYTYAVGASLTLSGKADNTEEVSADFVYKNQDLLEQGHIFRNTLANNDLQYFDAAKFEHNLLITDVKDVSLGAGEKNIIWNRQDGGNITIGDGAAAIWYWAGQGDGKLDVTGYKMASDRLYLLDVATRTQTADVTYDDKTQKATFKFDEKSVLTVSGISSVDTKNNGYNVVFATTNETASFDGGENTKQGDGILLGQLAASKDTLKYQTEEDTRDVYFYGGGAETFKIDGYSDSRLFKKFWLGHADADEDGTTKYVDNNVNVLDAEGSHRNLILVGNADKASTIKAGNWANNIWGGSKDNDTIYGSNDALTIYWFGSGDGKDTIVAGTTSTKYSDIVYLYNVSSADIANNILSVDGSELNINRDGATSTLRIGTSKTNKDAIAELQNLTFQSSDCVYYTYDGEGFAVKQ